MASQKSMRQRGAEQCSCVQSLRAALHRMSGSSSFEDLLRGADTNEASVPRSAALPELLPISLLRRPDIFTLAVVWESLQVCLLAFQCLGICRL